LRFVLTQVQLNEANKRMTETKMNMARLRAEATAHKTALHNAHNKLFEQNAALKVGSLLR
jgi:hypothetical protein